MNHSATPELASAAVASGAGSSFRHDALFYDGEDDFLDGTLPFIAEGLRAGEAVFVAVSRQRLELLERALGEDAERVRFLDIRQLGRNPARMIPAWLSFRAEAAEEGRSARGIGEPIWPGRSQAEIDECERQDAVLQEVFADGPAWRLLCPYDLRALDAETILAARSSHGPPSRDAGTSAGGESAKAPNQSDERADRAPGPFDGRLPDPPQERVELTFADGALGAIRRLVAAHGSTAGLSQPSREDLVLAVNELATNSLQYGGGGGTLRIWHEPDGLVCDVQDAGFIRDPLVGRLPPPVEQYGGRGLWLVNHLCDLVQIRSGENATVVRVHMRSDREPWPA
jgi:anti-sigma regulatory factor (Ser/Thr protein kinase)